MTDPMTPPKDRRVFNVFETDGYIGEPDRRRSALRGTGEDEADALVSLRALQGRGR